MAPRLLPEGTYIGKILDFSEPFASQSRKGLFYIRLSIGIEDQTTMMHVAGYLDAMHMLYCSRSFWIGKDVKVRIRHQVFDEDRVYTETRIMNHGKEV